MTRLNLPEFRFKVKETAKKKYIFDEIRHRYIVLTPEEWVRQNFVKYLVQYKNYSASLIVLEKPANLFSSDIRSDIVIYNNIGKIILLVECKSPDVSITQKTFDQTASYNLKLKAEFLIITNGISHYCFKPDYKKRSWIFLEDIPDYKELKSFFVD